MYLLEKGYKKLKDNLYFESETPRFNAYIDLKTLSDRPFRKETRNKINNSKYKGLYLVKGNIDDIKDFYSCTDKDERLVYYRDLYSKMGEKIDLLLVKVDYQKFITDVQNRIDEETDKNS